MDFCNKLINHFEAIPRELVEKILFDDLADFESLRSCETVNCLWNKLLNSKQYQIDKENYFAKKLFNQIDNFPEYIIQDLGGKKAICQLPKTALKIYEEIDPSYMNFNNNFFPALRKISPDELEGKMICRGVDSKDYPFIAFATHGIEIETKKAIETQVCILHKNHTMFFGVLPWKTSNISNCSYMNPQFLTPINSTIDKESKTSIERNRDIESLISKGFFLTSITDPETGYSHHRIYKLGINECPKLIDFIPIIFQSIIDDEVDALNKYLNSISISVKEEANNLFDSLKIHFFNMTGNLDAIEEVEKGAHQ